VWLSSDWFIGFTDLGMKNHEPNQTWSVSIGLDRFQTEPNKVGYFFGLVQFELSVSLVLSEPLTPLLYSLSPRYYCYLISNNINRGIQRILTAAYFSATKSRQTALLQTNKNCNFFKPLSFILSSTFKISNANCLDETTIPVDTILYL